MEIKFNFADLHQLNPYFSLIGYKSSDAMADCRKGPANIVAWFEMRHAKKAVCAACALLLHLNSAQASDTGLGLVLNATNFFKCAVKDMDTTMGVCKEPLDDGSLAVGLVEIMAVACKSPADIAGLKRADVVVAINGVTINGLPQDDYEDLLETAGGGRVSWVVLRKSFGRWEKKEVTLIPADIGDDFSCGVPDLEQ